MQYCLEIHTDEKPVLTYLITKAGIRVGKGTFNDLMIPDEKVSNYHFLLNYSGDGFTIADKSGKGVVVNGVQVEKSNLDIGDEITLGSLKVRLSIIIEDHNEEKDSKRDTGISTNILNPEKLPGRSNALLTPIGKESIKFVLKGDPVSIGTSEDCQIRLEDRFISSFHCRLYRLGGKWRIADLGSTNGTFVNDVRITECELPYDARILIGKTELFFSIAEPALQAEPFFQGMAGCSSRMTEVFHLIEKVAVSDASILITGETGTGKELVARALHRLSGRNNGAFIPINCAAIAKEIIESELFGHEKGAFTGAAGLRKGAFEEADRGTLFLDEIGEVPLEVQTKLLRAVEYGEIKRVGANKPVNVSARIISATNRNLPQAIKAGRFREDLFYRINVIPIRLPSLRDRNGDIGILARHFVMEMSGGKRGLTKEACSRLESHKWPGNVRELKNVLTRALVLSDSRNIKAENIEFLPMVLSDYVESEQAFSGGRTLFEIEKSAILSEMERQEGDQEKTAQALGIPVRTLMEKLKIY